MGRYFPYTFKFSSPKSAEACADRLNLIINSPQLHQMMLYRYTLYPVEGKTYRFEVAQVRGLLRFRAEGTFHPDGHGKTLIEGTAFIQLRYIVANMLPFVPVLLLSLFFTRQGQIALLLPAAILLIILQGGFIRAYQRQFIQHIHHDFL